MPGADVAPDVGPRARAVGRGRRCAQEFRSALVSGRGADRGDGRQGLPGQFVKGSEIIGLTDAGNVEGVEVFHAGTRREGDRILANGGRVLNVCALGKTVAQAQARAYAAVDKIKWPEGFCRRDIGFRAVERERITR